MKLLIDTNVILDMIFKRAGFEDVVKLLRKIKENKHESFITASSVTDLFYIIRKETHSVEKTYEYMKFIFKLVDILGVTSTDINEALENKWKDFEDCVQFVVAKNSEINYIVTSNIRDYKGESVAVITPQDCIQII
jgi:predicted nucleic acid-binding protein